MPTIDYRRDIILTLAPDSLRGYAAELADRGCSVEEARAALLRRHYQSHPELARRHGVKGHGVSDLTDLDLVRAFGGRPRTMRSGHDSGHLRDLTDDQLRKAF